MKTYMHLAIFYLLMVPLCIKGKDRITAPVTRTITKTFDVSSGAQLTLSNKYGKVNLHTWSRNQIKAVITITANSSGGDNSQSLINLVNIQSDQSGNNVTLTTIYKPGSGSSFWSRFFGSGNHRGNTVRIDYDIYVPQSLAMLHIDNNYGDVAGNDIPGNFSLNINYGNFYLNKVAGSLQLDANYSGGSVNGVVKGNINANYTNFNAGQISNLQIHSNYSDCKISDAGELQFNGNYGNFSADQIDGITSRSNYTDYKIGTLQQHANMSTTYGDIKIQALGDQLKSMMIHSTYGNVKIGIPANLPLRLNIDLTSGNIHTGKIPLQVEERISDHRRNILKAVIERKESDLPVVQIQGTYSDVTLMEK